MRRCLADIALLCFHLVISKFTFRGVDIKMAQTILDWNLQQYPDGKSLREVDCFWMLHFTLTLSGVFFLFGQGRLHLLHSQPSLAIDSYTRAMSVQSQYRNLHYISYWEMALAHFALWQIEASLTCWRILEAEATWSKACYLYGAAACLLQLGGKERLEEAETMLRRIPSVVHKIAGKSIPIEVCATCMWISSGVLYCIQKFVARKARKFKSQGGLILPALELAYTFFAITHTPHEVIVNTMLPVIDDTLKEIVVCERDPLLYQPPYHTTGCIAGSSRAAHYWDDFCLAYFLKGICLRYVAYPVKTAFQLNFNSILLCAYCNAFETGSRCCPQRSQYSNVYFNGNRTGITRFR